MAAPGYQVTTGSVTGPAAGPTQDVLSLFASLLGQAQPVFSNVLSPGYTDISQNPQAQSLIDAITQANQQAFVQSVIPSINAAAQQSGNFFSSGRQNALSQAGQQFAQGQTQALAGPLFDLFRTLQGQQLSIAGLPASGILGAAPLYGQSTTYSKQPEVGGLGIAGTILGGLGSLGSAFGGTGGVAGGLGPLGLGIF